MTRRVSYFYDQDVGSFVYGEGHPMRPFRINMTHQLILAYGLYRKMNVYQPNRASDQQMTVFHSQNYIEHLKRVAPNLLEDKGSTSIGHGAHQASCSRQIEQDKNQFNVGENDCPWFPGLFEFSQISCGASIDAAIKLNHRSSDLCINWAGGLHHAKKQQAKGFCYVNDIVLAILELLKYHQRVLYIDIDVHHGDGVEEAFFTTNRVMTVSFHRYGDFFPGTGDLRDIGEGEGKGYAVNVPLQSGLDDDSFVDLYERIIQAVMERFRPEAVVLQCGADSLAYDKLGTYNTTLRGHGACVRITKQWGLPLLVLGGGGYTIKNVARCWAYETGICLDQELDNDLPLNDYYELLGNDKKLHFEARTDQKNDNSPEYLQFIQAKCLNNINSLEHAPSLGITDFIPKDFYPEEQIEKNKITKADHYDDLTVAEQMNQSILKPFK